MSRTGPRAFTLLELLLALTLLLALAAITVPVVTRTLDERRFESSADQVTQQLLLARARAESDGRPVEVVYLGERREVRVRWFDAESLGDGGADDPPATVPTSWASRVLPGDVRLTDEDPAAETGAARFGAAAPTRSGAAADSFRIAVFMPDGSALMTRRAWLLDDAERVGTVRLNSFTGLPVFERRIGEAVPDDDDEDDEDEDDGELDDFELDDFELDDPELDDERDPLDAEPQEEGP